MKYQYLIFDVEFILEQGWGEIHMNRNEGLSIRGGGTPAGGTGTAGTAPKPSTVRKYQCPCCGNSVRATKEVHIACLDCGVPMVLVTK